MHMCYYMTMARTTIIIDDFLLKQAKRHAIDRDITLTKLVEEGLLLAMSPRGEANRHRSGKLNWPTVRCDGPPAVDLADRHALYDLMDSER